MLSENRKVFDEFQTIHDKYAADETKWQSEYNRQGEKVLELIKEYEDRLCSNTERGMYSAYSGNLSEKFRNEIRSHYALIDFIGVKISKTTASLSSNVFSIKKLL